MNNLHGMPGVISGLASIVAVYVASEATYGPSYYKIFPEAAPIDGSSQLRMFKFGIIKKFFLSAESLTSALQFRLRKI